MDSSAEKKEEIRQQLRLAALEYHEFPTPGKISVTPTKQLTNQRDLALAYSPGVAAPCEEIVIDPAAAYKYTARGNLVAVITNGTAVLGLGNIGPLAAKPVMEGKGVLFKKFAGIDVFDIEINELDPDKLVDIIAALEPTFGGVNLEDIKAPECFYIERQLRERMKIPVFHDDQLVRVRFVDLDVEDVDAGEFLEQHALAFHHRLGGQRTDVAQAQHGGAVGDDGHQVAARRVFIGGGRVDDDFFARGGHARGVGKRQIALVGQLLGRRNADFAWGRELVVLERGDAQLLTNFLFFLR